MQTQPKQYPAYDGKAVSANWRVQAAIATTEERKAREEQGRRVETAEAEPRGRQRQRRNIPRPWYQLSAAEKMEAMQRRQQSRQERIQDQVREMIRANADRKSEEMVAALPQRRYLTAYQKRMLLSEKPDLTGQDIARPDRATCERLVEEDSSIMTAHFTHISEVLDLSAKYEAVRKILPMLEEVPFEKWYAGMAPVKSAVIAEQARREQAWLVALYVATSFIVAPESSVVDPEPVHASQSCVERTEQPKKLVVSRKFQKAFRMKATRTPELEVRFWRIAANKNRSHYAEMELADIGQEFVRRGVDVFHSIN